MEISLNEALSRIKELEKENALYKYIIDNVHEGIMVTDKNGTIIVYNPVVAKAEGLKQEDMLNKKEDHVYTDAEYSFVKIEKEVAETGKPVIEQQFVYYSPAGKKIHLLYSIYPFTYQGKNEGVITFGRDVQEINSFISSSLAFQRQLNAKKNKKSDSAIHFLNNIIGTSAVMKDCKAKAQKIAQHDVPTMIVGETGSGKEMFAQGIHNASKFASGPFVSVNCAALPESLLESILFGTCKGSFTGAADLPGLFEQAENGSLFLDEINSMPIVLQSKLLRAIQEKKVRRLGGKTEIDINCRIISATNWDPFDIDNENTQTEIRSDLLFRLSTAIVKIPPLRERKEDIPELCQYFMRKGNQNKSIFLWNISPQLLALLNQYNWPGNVRELENVVQSSIIFADNQERFLKLEHIPEHIRYVLLKKTEQKKYVNIDLTLKDAVSDFEKRMINDVLFRTKGNISKAATILGITRQNLYFKLEKYNMKDYISTRSK